MFAVWYKRVASRALNRVVLEYRKNSVFRHVFRKNDCSWCGRTRQWLFSQSAIIRLELTNSFLNTIRTVLPIIMYTPSGKMCSLVTRLKLVLHFSFQNSPHADDCRRFRTNSKKGPHLLHSRLNRGSKSRHYILPEVRVDTSLATGTG